LNEAGFREQAAAAAIGAAVASGETEKEEITESRSGRMMKTSRAQMDRLLDQWQFGAEQPRKSWTQAEAVALTLRKVLPNERARRLDTSNQCKFGWFRAGAQTAKIHTARMAPSVAKPLMVQPAT
jgi:hypothetical protein